MNLCGTQAAGSGGGRPGGRAWRRCLEGVLRAARPVLHCDLSALLHSPLTMARTGPAAQRRAATRQEVSESLRLAVRAVFMGVQMHAI